MLLVISLKIRKAFYLIFQKFERCAFALKKSKAGLLRSYLSESDEKKFDEEVLSKAMMNEDNKFIGFDAFGAYRLLGRDDIKRLPPVQWAVKNIVPAKGVVLLYGPSGSGKSFLAFDLACNIAGGDEWFGEKVRNCPVVYVALEGQYGFRRRAEAWESVNNKKLPNNFKMVMQDFKFTDSNHVSMLAGIVPKGSLVIIDTLNRAAQDVDENLSRDMGMIIEAACVMQRACQGLIMIVHHSGKVLGAGPRGHSSLFANCDAVIEVARDGVARKWTLAKSKEGEDGRFFPFVLDQKDLGLDDDGEVISSCAVRALSVGVNGFEKSKQPQGANQRAALGVI